MHILLPIVVYKLSLKIMSLAYIRSVQRGCTYCKNQGHLKPNCPVAFQKCEEIKANINQILNSRIQEEERLNTLFTAENLTDLCFLMNERGFKEFIKKLAENGIITEEESKMRLKRHRVRVLMVRYWYSSVRYTELQARKAQRIAVKTPSELLETDLTDFECPICVSEVPAKEKIQTGCNHCVCKNCFVRCLEHKILNMDYLPPKCSMCRAQITQVTIFNTDYVNEVTELTNVM
jgi:hypothetical protein